MTSTQVENFFKFVKKFSIVVENVYKSMRSWNMVKVPAVSYNFGKDLYEDRYLIVAQTDYL